MEEGPKEESKKHKEQRSSKGLENSDLSDTLLPPRTHTRAHTRTHTHTRKRTHDTFNENDYADQAIVFEYRLNTY